MVSRGQELYDKEINSIIELAARKYFNIVFTDCKDKGEYLWLPEESICVLFCGNGTSNADIYNVACNAISNGHIRVTFIKSDTDKSSLELGRLCWFRYSGQDKEIWGSLFKQLFKFLVCTLTGSEPDDIQLDFIRWRYKDRDKGRISIIYEDLYES